MLGANFLELRKAEVQLPRSPKRRSSQNAYSTHSGEKGLHVSDEVTRKLPMLYEDGFMLPVTREDRGREVRPTVGHFLGRMEPVAQQDGVGVGPGRSMLQGLREPPAECMLQRAIVKGGA